MGNNWSRSVYLYFSGMIVLVLGVISVFNPGITGLASYAPSGKISLLEYFPQATENTTFTIQSDMNTTLNGITLTVTANSLVAYTAKVHVIATTGNDIRQQTITIPLTKPPKKPVDAAIQQELDSKGYSRVIVLLKPIKDLTQQQFRIDSIQQQLVEKNEYAIEWEFDETVDLEDGFAGYITKEGIEKLREDPNVAKIIIDKPVEAFLQDSKRTTGTGYVHRMNITGNSTVCVIDTGIDYTHPALGGCLGDGCQVIDGKNFCANSDCTEQSDNPMDDHGHGTHVAGIVAASSTNLGMAPGARLVGVKSLNSHGQGYYSTVRAGIEWCRNKQVADNITVITMSLGDGGGYDKSTCPTGIDESINNASSAGIIIVAATGNNFKKTGISYPACSPNVISVGATSGDKVTSYTNSGSLLDLLAPGSSINSTNIGGTYIKRSGTSMATPHVAGIITLLLQAGVAPSSLVSLLNKTGRQITDTNGIRRARVNAYAALLYHDKNITLTDNAMQHYYGRIVYDELTARDVHTCVRFSPARIFVNSTLCPHLNKSAHVTLQHLNWQGARPVIINKNTTPCTETTNPSCTNQEYDGENLSFTLSHFTMVGAERADLTPPNLSAMVQPKIGEGNFTLAVTAADNENISAVLATVQYANQSNMTREMVNHTSQYVLILHATTLGINTISIRVNDSDNNINTTQLNFTVADATPPTISFSIIPNESSATNVSINATILDNHNVSTVLANISWSNGTSVLVAMPKTFEANLPGKHTLTLIANDTSNNVNSSTHQFIIYGPQPPNITLQVVPKHAYPGSLFTITTNITANLSLDRVTMNITGPNYTLQQLLTVYSMTVNATAVGEYLVRVTANDSGGNTNESLTSYTVVSLDPVPSVRLTIPTTTVRHGQVLITATIDDTNLDTVRIMVDGIPQNVTNTSNNYTTTLIPERVGVFSILVVANDTNNGVNTTQQNLTVLNQPPEFSSVLQSSGNTPYDSEDLLLTTNAIDKDGDSLYNTTIWYLNGESLYDYALSFDDGLRESAHNKTVQGGNVVKGLIGDAYNASTPLLLENVTIHTIEFWMNGSFNQSLFTHPATNATITNDSLVFSMDNETIAMPYTGNWTHVAYSMDDERRLMVNGELITHHATSNTSGTLSIHFDGLLDNLRVWTRPASTAQLVSAYYRERQGFNNYVLADEETKPGDRWSANVTVFDGYTSNTTQTNTLLIMATPQPTPITTSGSSGSSGSGGRFSGKTPSPPSPTPAASIGPTLASHPPSPITRQALQMADTKQKEPEQKEEIAKPVQLEQTLPVQTRVANPWFCDSRQRILRIVSFLCVLVAFGSLFASCRHKNPHILLASLPLFAAALVSFFYHANCDIAPLTAYAVLPMAALLLLTTFVLRRKNVRKKPKPFPRRTL